MWEEALDAARTDKTGRIKEHLADQAPELHAAYVSISVPDERSATIFIPDGFLSLPEEQDIVEPFVLTPDEDPSEEVVIHPDENGEFDPMEVLYFIIAYSKRGDIPGMNIDAALDEWIDLQESGEIGRYLTDNDLQVNCMSCPRVTVVGAARTTDPNNTILLASFAARNGIHLVFTEQIPEENTRIPRFDICINRASNNTNVTQIFIDQEDQANGSVISIQNTPPYLFLTDQDLPSAERYPAWLANRLRETYRWRFLQNENFIENVLNHQLRSKYIIEYILYFYPDITNSVLQFPYGWLYLRQMTNSHDDGEAGTSSMGDIYFGDPDQQVLKDLVHDLEHFTFRVMCTNGDLAPEFHDILRVFDNLDGIPPSARGARVLSRLADGLSGGLVYTASTEWTRYDSQSELAKIVRSLKEIDPDFDPSRYSGAEHLTILGTLHVVNRLDPVDPTSMPGVYGQAYSRAYNRTFAKWMTEHEGYPPNFKSMSAEEQCRWDRDLAVEIVIEYELMPILDEFSQVADLNREQARALANKLGASPENVYEYWARKKKILGPLTELREMLADEPPNGLAKQQYNILIRWVQDILVSHGNRSSINAWPLLHLFEKQLSNLEFEDTETVIQLIERTAYLAAELWREDE